MDEFEELNQVDICIVIDTTGSMSPFIIQAREEARKFAEEVAAREGLDIRYAVVEYRDHPPQDVTFVARIYPFGDAAAFQVNLDSLRADGGGDEPEAVLDGLVEAAKLQWRDHADKLCFLIGDSPPHGVGGLSQWPEGCPCKATPNGVVELFASQKIKLHALSIAGNPITTKSFGEMALAIPGGTVREEKTPLGITTKYGETLAATGMTVGASRSYAAASSNLSMAGVEATDEKVAEALGWTVDAVTGTRNYLASRGIDPDKWKKKS